MHRKLAGAMPGRPLCAKLLVLLRRHRLHLVGLVLIVDVVEAVVAAWLGLVTTERPPERTTDGLGGATLAGILAAHAHQGTLGGGA